MPVSIADLSRPLGLATCWASTFTSSGLTGRLAIGAGGRRTVHAVNIGVSEERCVGQQQEDEQLFYLQGR